MRRFSWLRGFSVLLLGCWLALIELPDTLALLRPMFPALMLAYLSFLSRSALLLPVAWLYGLFLDVLFGAPLGQHAMVMTLLCFTVSKLSGLMRVVALWQSALVMLPVWLLSTFLLFWMDGTAQHAADLGLRWIPALTTACVWPAVEALARHRNHVARMAGESGR